ncbi:hypothetical protein F511_33036 [Dorcoceras hygrometricum]|uniref:Dystroglycan-like n=1 Tax=Dorcoceras hygrometricum TaxID=472368 RepID=A0A2Z7CLZ9_9LAMI|nr:hypothetical protein F511_33036 [Dorcoceras hygrometricum]
MASSLISSNHHVDFESVFGFDDAGMVQMFETLISTGLKNFLGCPAVFYEAALTEFFTNGSVRDGLVVSTVNGVTMEISEKVFAAAFDLPIDGLIYLSDVPKNLVFDARSLFSASKEQVSISCFKKEMKVEYLLLHDILEKTLFVKAGSFDVVTRERFMLMTAITFDVKVNWSNLLFGVLKAMVTPGSRQAKGFAIQIGVILQKVPGLELGDSRPFPASRVLTEKTVHRFVNINEQVGMENTSASPRVKKTPVKKAMSKKRQVGAAEMPAEQPSKPKRKTQKRKRRLVLDDADETGDSAPEQPAAEIAAGAQVPSVDDPVATQPDIVATVEATNDDRDAVIKKVLNQLDVVFQTDDGEQSQGIVVKETVVAAKEPHWFDLPYDDLIAKWDAERPVVTASDTDEDVETLDVGAAGGDQQVQFSEEEPEDVEMREDKKVDGLIDADEKMSLEDILRTIPVDVPLASTGIEITKITMGKETRSQVIDAVDQFFHSFSLKKLATINIEELSKKEEQVLCWGETETTHIALNRKSSGGASSKSGFCVQCGGKHPTSHCHGVLGACHTCGQIGHFARMFLPRDSILICRSKVLLEVLRGDRIQLLSPSDKTINHLKRLGSEGLINLSNRDFSGLK